MRTIEGKSFVEVEDVWPCWHPCGWLVGKEFALTTPHDAECGAVLSRTQRPNIYPAIALNHIVSSQEQRQSIDQPANTKVTNTMSQQSSSFTSFTSTSYSSSSSSNGQQVSGQRAMQTSSTDPSGQTTVQSASQNLGEPVVQETRTYDQEGRQLISGGNDGAGVSMGRRIEDVSDEQKERDRVYEERMEDEYAKREGGA